MPKIIFYFVHGSQPCIKVRQLLEKEGVKYEEIDISNDEEKTEEMAKRTGSLSVPVLIIEDREQQIIIGYEPEVILRAIKK